MRQVRGGVEIKPDIRTFFLVAIAVVILDQVTKFLIMKLLPVYSIIEVIPGFFELVHFRNTGAAFSLFSEGGGILRKVFLIGTSSVALIVIWFLLKDAKDKVMEFALSLIAGGALGNLIDRVRLGEVVDFLYFSLKNYHWPAFNVADTAITVGVGLALFSYLKGAKK